eukprot:3586108-Pleurochrysis_carterae.AAC.1
MTEILRINIYDSSSPRNPVFAALGSTAPVNLQSTTRQTSSQSQGAPAQATATSAAPAAATVS